MPKKPTKEQDTFIAGGLCAVIGLYAIVSDITNFGNVLAGFFFVGVGVVLMASTNEEFRKQFFGFIFSIFRGLWKFLSGSK
jgi:hypothetical protein